MSRDRLVEIQTWLNAGPRLGCLLCVGKPLSAVVLDL